MLTHFGVKLLAGNMAPKYVKGWGVQVGTPLEWTYLLLEKKLCQNWMWVVKVEVRGGGTHVEHTNRRECIFLFPL